MSIKIKIPETEITITEEELNFNSLEQKIWEAQMQQGGAVLEKIMEEVDDILAKNREAGLKNKGFRQKYICTRFGEILYRRRAYYDQDKKFHYLLDEKMGLKKAQQVSVSRAKLEASLASTESYRETERNFRSFFGSSRSFEAMRQMVLRIGKALQKEEEIKARELFENGEISDSAETLKDFAFLEADGTGIALQGESKKRGEIKLGIGYEGWERRYKAGKGKSFKLVKKFVYMGIEEGEKFTEKFSLFANQKLRLDKVKHLIVGGDGARWITKGLLGFFRNVTYQLCKFHLNKAIKTALAFSKKTQRIIKDKLYRDKIEEAVLILNKIALKRNPKEKKKIEDLMLYIINNREGINGIKRLKKKLNKKEREKLRSTGTIEGNIDKNACNRFKKRGMSWSIPGANCLLKIKEKILNNEWDDWWHETKGLQPLPGVMPKKQRNILGKPNHDIWGEYLEHNLPALHGPAQDRKWVEWLKEKIYLTVN